MATGGHLAPFRNAGANRRSANRAARHLKMPRSAPIKQPSRAAMPDPMRRGAAAAYLTKLRYDANASIWLRDNFLVILGIGGPTAT